MGEGTELMYDRKCLFFLSHSFLVWIVGLVWSAILTMSLF